MRVTIGGRLQCLGVLVNALAAAACSSTPRTEIIVVVTSDLLAGAEYDRLAVRVETPSRRTLDVGIDVGEGGVPGGATLAVEWREGALGPLGVTATAMYDGAPVVSTAVETEFVRKESKLLELHLARACIDPTCAEGETCRTGECVALHVSGLSLPAWTGRLPAADAGVDEPDADAGPDAEPDATTRRGACCAQDETCLPVETLTSCLALGGLYQGTGSNCGDEVNCPQAWTGLVELTLGGDHSCVRRGIPSRAYCWGINDWGQLGVGDLEEHSTATLVQIDPGSGWTTISAGYDQTCGVYAGAVYCWGRKGNERIKEPRSVVPLARSLVGVGDSFACATSLIGGAGRTICWGSDTYGQLGDGDDEIEVGQLVVVALTRPPSELAAGASHACARLADGSVYCWGHNSLGQLGTGDNEDRLSPTGPVLSGGTALLAEAISPGSAFTCALAAGEVYCWGDNRSRQLGLLAPLGLYASDPIRIALAADVVPVAVATGWEHACVLTELGQVECWGLGTNGQLGHGVAESSLEPRRVVQIGDTLPEAIAVAAGRGHTCALVVGGDVYCWGDNSNGQLGNGMMPDTALTPQLVVVGL